MRMIQDKLDEEEVERAYRAAITRGEDKWSALAGFWDDDKQPATCDVVLNFTPR